MKKIVLWILLIAILMSCAGCTSGSGSTEEQENAAVELIAQQISDAALRTSNLLRVTLEEYRKEREAYLPLGNAGELEGRIVIFTVFAGGTDYTWDFSKQEDVEQKSKCLKDLSEAAAYLTDQAARYGKDVEFLYD